MKKEKREKLDELIYKAINGGSVQFDAEKWREKYAEEFELLKSRAGGQSRRVRVRRIIVKRTITGIAAVAAVIIIGVLIGVAVLDLDERPGAEVVSSQREARIAERTKDVRQAEVLVEGRLWREKIKKMFADGDVEGLRGVLSKGRFAEKVLAGVCLAEIGDKRALPLLEELYLLAKKDLPEDDTTGILENAIEKIKERVEAEQGKVADEEKPEEEAEEDAEGVLDFRVVDKATKGPIAAVKLEVSMDGVSRWAKTDGEGRYRFKIGKKAPDFMSVRVYGEGYVHMMVEFYPQGDFSRIPVSYTLEVEGGTLIGGIVQGEDGLAIEGAKVYVRLLGRGKGEKVWLWDPYFETDSEGRWQCDIAPAELGGLQLRLVHSDYVSDEDWGDRAVPPAGELRSQRGVMIMKSGLRVIGKVLDMGGRPIKGARVYQGTERDGQFFMDVETDEQGWFSFGARAGVVTLRASAEGYQPEETSVEVGEDINEVEFRLEWARTISGQVVDSDDRPVAGASVKTSGQQDIPSLKWSGVTDSNGCFEWNSAPANKVYFDISKAGYMTIWRTPLVSVSDTYIITIYRQLRISGNVVDADSGEPVDSFELIPGLKWENRVDVSWQRWKGAESSGGFYEHEFKYACEGYFIRIEADGYKPVVSRQFYVDEGSVGFDFKLEKGTGPEGTVYLAAGGPAVNADVILATPSQLAYLHNGRLGNEKENKFVKTDAEGRFSFPPQDKRYTLAIVHDGGYAEITDVQLAANSDIYLELWGRVEGMVFVGDEPKAAEELTLETERRRSSASKTPQVRHFSRTRTDSSGFFAFDRVVPGITHQVGCVVELGESKYSTHLTKKVVVESGGTVRVELGREGRPVIGKVAAPAETGELIDWSYSNNSLLVREPGKGYQDSYGFKIEQDGTFRIEGVKAGGYNLQINVYEHDKDGWGGYDEMIGKVNYEFEVPEMEAGQSDEPLDIGTLELKMVERLKVGDIAPPLEGMDFEGGRVRLSDYRDKVVLLVFWTKERFASEDKVSHMKWIHEGYSVDEQFAMIGVPTDSDFETAKEFIKDRGLEWINCWLDEQAKKQMFDNYAKGGLPYTLVIGEDGKILGKNQTGQELELLLEMSLEK